MDHPLGARGWEPRGVHKRRRLRPSVFQRLGAVAGDVPTRLNLPFPLRRREGDGEDDEEGGDTEFTGKKRRQDDDDDPGKKGKGKGKGKDQTTSTTTTSSTTSSATSISLPPPTTTLSTIALSTTVSASTTVSFTVSLITTTTQTNAFTFSTPLPTLTSSSAIVQSSTPVLTSLPSTTTESIILPPAISTFTPPPAPPLFTTTPAQAAPTSSNTNGATGLDDRTGLSSGATAGIIAGVLSAILLLAGALCFCSRRVRNRLLPSALTKRVRKSSAPSEQYEEAREPFAFGTITTSISGPGSIIQQQEQQRQYSRSLTSPSPATATAAAAAAAAAASPRPLLTRSSVSENTTVDDRSSVFSGLRQHPVSLLADSEAGAPLSFSSQPPSSLSPSPPPPAPMAGRDSLRPYPSTRGFGGALRDSSTSGRASSAAASSHAWTISQALASPRSDQFEYEAARLPMPPQPPPPPAIPDRAAQRLSSRRSDTSSVFDSLHRASQATSAFYDSGLSPAPALPPAVPAAEQNGVENPFLDRPHVPGMGDYAPPSLNNNGDFAAAPPRQVQPFPFAQPGSVLQATDIRVESDGDGDGGGGSNLSSQRDGLGSSAGVSLVEVTDVHRPSPPFRSPPSQFSRATSSEAGEEGTSASFSSDDGANEPSYIAESAWLGATTNFGKH